MPRRPDPAQPGPAGQPVPRHVLLLTHRGRRSGRLFTPPPLLHARDGADLVVAASNGGIDGEPKWWLNLQADPHGEVEVAGRRFALVASG